MSDKSKKKGFSPPSSSSLLLQSLPSSKPLSSQFLPGSVIDRFLALHSLGRGTSTSPAQSSTSPPNSTGRISTKRQKLSPAIPTKHPPHTRTPLRHPLSSLTNQYTTTSGPKSKVQTDTTGCSGTESLACATALDHRDNNNALACTVFSTEPVRSYDRLQPPSLETHRYIASSRILQNRALVNALIDPECGRVQLVERDFEYLRMLLPTGTSNHTTTRVEADLILDEDTAIVLYPLRELGQATIQDSNAGLNELLAVLARIGPRFKTVWLMLEEYTWSSTAAASRQRRSSTAVEGCSPVSWFGSFPGSTPALVPRINAFAGPVTAQLNKLMAWIPSTHDRQHWRSRMTNRIEPQQGFYHPGNVHDQLLSVFKGADAFRFETRVLYASDERYTARIVRAIGEGIVTRINSAVAAGVRRDEDGWCSGKEWLWRDWLNDVDSTHERLLGLFQLFNPFSIQLILSLCSVKEFLAMDHRQRVRTVGKFIDVEILSHLNIFGIKT
ncbi:hypothetical protein BG011_003006 [Mortierella polycephala]|uniref:DUF7102 domain-containing protein n=1 Tax=Mortierella polycephala TaxID=41804 RepID=A0A9P6Q408_9FUNG|nr:hypothetical protein BG011_003006 [Mortierella polycephala]